ncbi:MAG: DoxX family protein [Acidobacteriaceae bacterium]
MIYGICTLILLAAWAAFFLLARGRSLTPFGRLQAALRILVTLPLFISGTAHLVDTAAFVRLVPPVFHARSLLVVLTGLCEIAGGVGLFVPATRRIAALCLAALMIAIFPANIYVAGETIHGLPMPGVAVRLVMQAMYLWLILLAGWGWPQPAPPSIPL